MGGKTYSIVNNVIPNTDKDYIILSPSHVSVGEYRKNRFNADTSLRA